MPALTIAALEAGAAAGSIDDWLSSLPGDAQRSRLRRAIEMDRRLWTEHPASLASCLLARTLHLDELAALREAWTAELDARDAPWIRPLRALPVADGLLAELHGSPGLPLDGLQRARFLSDEVLVLEAIRFHPTVQAPELRRRDRLRWSWARGEATLEPAPDEPEAGDRYPRIESDGWGPAFLVRAPGVAREPLPCPEGGSASARLGDDGRRLFVYGTHDEYAGGFALVLDPRTLAIRRKLETAAPVSAVHECARDDLLLIQTYRGLLMANGDRLQPLPMAAREACLSPSGRHLATAGAGLRIWSVAEIGRGPERPPGGFPTCFDPSGERLLSHRQLFDGRTGERVAELSPELGEYLEGGPASPWFHLGERFLVCMHASLGAWKTQSGAPVGVRERLRFAHWYTLAYDRAGTRLAVLRDDGSEVAIHELPSGRRTVKIGFELSGRALAMSADGAAIAVRAGPAIEVRSARGALIRRLAHPGEADPRERESMQGPGSLRFSADGQRLASLRAGDGWRIWALEGDHAEHLAAPEAIDAADGFAAPRPRDWDVEAGTATVFVHHPTGTRIALPAAGPWVHSPADPWYLACDDLHVELRARGAQRPEPPPRARRWGIFRW